MKLAAILKLTTASSRMNENVSSLHELRDTCISSHHCRKGPRKGHWLPPKLSLKVIDKVNKRFKSLAFNFQRKHPTFPSTPALGEAVLTLCHAIPGDTTNLSMMSYPGRQTDTHIWYYYQGRKQMISKSLCTPPDRQPRYRKVVEGEERWILFFYCRFCGV